MGWITAVCVECSIFNDADDYDYGHTKKSKGEKTGKPVSYFEKPKDEV